MWLPRSAWCRVDENVLIDKDTPWCSPKVLYSQATRLKSAIYQNGVFIHLTMNIYATFFIINLPQSDELIKRLSWRENLLNNSCFLYRSLQFWNLDFNNRWYP